MVFNSFKRTCHTLLVGMAVLIAVVVISASAFAQSDSNPKWDVFAGYQYLASR